MGDLDLDRSAKADENLSAALVCVSAPLRARLQDTRHKRAPGHEGKIGELHRQQNSARILLEG